ncbi:MAG: hypothetical protein RPT25_15405 [Cycloclasticus sp.]
MNNQIALVIAVVMLAIAVLVGPILLHEYKFSQCMKDFAVTSHCLKQVNGQGN